MTTTYSSPKAPGETITVSFDFAALTTSPSGVTCTIEVAGGPGTDTSPSAMKSGAALVQGTKGFQTLVGGVSDVDYRLLWACDAPDGSRYIEPVILQVRAPR